MQLIAIPSKEFFQIPSFNGTIDNNIDFLNEVTNDYELEMEQLSSLRVSRIKQVHGKCKSYISQKDKSQ